MSGGETGFWIALLVMVIGVAGTILPALPGTGLIWVAALAYGVWDKFTTLTPAAMVVLTVLALIGLISDLLLAQAGSRLAGASWQAIAAGVVLGAIGFVAGAFVGGIGAVPLGVIGTLVGILVVEYRHRRDWVEALKAGGGWLAGCILSRAIQFGLATVMVVFFVWQAGFNGVWAG